MMSKPQFTDGDTPEGIAWFLELSVVEYVRKINDGLITIGIHYDDRRWCTVDTEDELPAPDSDVSSSLLIERIEQALRPHHRDFDPGKYWTAGVWQICHRFHRHRVGEAVRLLYDGKFTNKYLVRVDRADSQIIRIPTGTSATEWRRAILQTAGVIILERLPEVTSQ